LPPEVERALQNFRLELLRVCLRAAEKLDEGVAHDADGREREHRGGDREAQRQMVGPSSSTTASTVRATSWLRRISRRVRTAAAALLLVAGLLLISEAVVTVVWQEPLSALYTSRQQDALGDQLRKAETAALAAPASFVARRQSERRPAAILARRHRRTTGTGDPLGRIQIPELGKSFVFVEGSSGNELEKGPGHYSGTTLPGERGTVGIAGHRTTYLAPFRNIDRLDRGDRVVLKMPYGTFRYSVEGSAVVSPTNTSSLRRVRHNRLTLTTCTPPFSAEKRLVVMARLESKTLLRSS
jgi:sortase A